MVQDRSEGLVADPLFVALTRPAMAFGVPYAALLVNVVLTMEVFIVTHQLLWLLAFGPVHALFYLLCRYEPRIFDLVVLWAQTRARAYLAGTGRHWHASSHSPLPIDLPDRRGRRAPPAETVVL
jgi:type IV secretion system protein VirB3